MLTLCPDCDEPVETINSEQPMYHQGCCPHDNVETVWSNSGYNSFRDTVDNFCNDCLSWLYDAGEPGTGTFWEVLP